MVYSMLTELPLAPERITPLIHARHLGSTIGLPRLFLKLEGHTPSGNHKFWLAASACTLFGKGHWRGITAGSCGNYATSLAHLCRERGIPCVLFVTQPTDLPLLSAGEVQTIPVQGSYNEAVWKSRMYALEHSYLDANPGSIFSPRLNRTFEAIAQAVVAQLNLVPDVIVAPVGNGTTLAGVFRWFIRRSGHYPLPRIYGAITASNVLAGPLYAPNSGATCNLDPLSSDFPIDGMKARLAVERSQGCLILVPAETILQSHNELLRSEAVLCQPASAVVVGAVICLVTRGLIGRDETVIAILTTG